MEYISVIWSLLDQQFRPILATLAALFALFFYFKKIGNKVNVTYSVISQANSYTRISDLIFQNKKDKPVSIYRIVAVLDKSYYLEIKECSPPLILKPYESISVETDPFSNLSINGDRYFPDYYDADIYIESDEKIIKCKARAHKDYSYNFDKITKTIKRFNGIVYNDYVAYILVYAINGVEKTAFISDNGKISEEWDLFYNRIKGKNKNIQADEISLFLEQNFSKTIDTYLLYQINDQTLKFNLVKAHSFEKV